MNERNRDEMNNAFWTAYRDRRENLASRLGMSFSAVTDLVERRVGANLDLAKYIADLRIVPYRDLISFETSTHPFFSTPPKPPAAKASETQDPVCFWSPGLKAAVARRAKVSKSYSSAAIKRKFTPSFRVAIRLAAASGVNEQVWRSAKIAGQPHAIFLNSER